jgi:hypothetical protein
VAHRETISTRCIFPLDVATMCIVFSLARAQLAEFCVPPIAMGLPRMGHPDGWGQARQIPLQE